MNRIVSGNKPKLLLAKFAFLLINSQSFAAEFTDTGKIRWTAECLFSANKQESELYNRYSYNHDLRFRSEYFIGITAEYRRSNKKTSPWLSPLIAFSTGWFKSRIFTYDQLSGWYQTPYIPVESLTQSDTFEFTSITFIPQIGIIARPFLRKRKLSKLAFNLRTGYQTHWVQQLNSKSNIIVEQYLMNGLWINGYSHKNTTTNPTFRERKFPRWYLQCGISNEFKKTRLGYRITFSWQQQAQRGLEISLTRPLR